MPDVSSEPPRDPHDLAVPDRTRPAGLQGLLDEVWRRRALWLRADLAVAAGLVVLLLAAGTWWWWPRADPAPAARVEERLPLAAPATAAAASGTLVVHAAGAVLAPGVYELDAGSRVSDLIDAAGGPRLDADLDRLNLAALLTDGQRVAVPRVGEDAPPVVEGVAEAGTGSAAGLVAINTASALQLEVLPGVGPATAAAIVAHREEHGPFGTVDDLLDVSGIGPAKLDAIRDLVVLG